MDSAVTSYDWVRELKPEIKALDDVPLTGNAPPFPWDEMSQRLAKAFEREGLEIKATDPLWRTKDELFEGLGTSLSPLIFSVPALRGNVSWVMPEQELSVLESILLTKETHPITFKDKALSESFYRFFALEILYNLTQINFDKSISPVLTEETTVPQEDSLCLDISLILQKQTVWGRLIISPKLRKSWVDHFITHPPTVLTQKISELIDVIVHFEVGKTDMSLKEWNSVKKGDFIILDTCTLDKDNISGGRVNIAINGKQAFRGKLKDGTIKLLEHVLIHEVDTPMSKNEEDDDLSDLDFTEDELLEDEIVLGEDDEVTTSEASETQMAPPTAPAPPKQFTAPQAAKPANSTATSPSSQPASRKSSIDTGKIPISVVVEISRVHMTVDKLLQLEPGNLLELNVKPEDGVNLSINGKIVGKGELFKIGEVLGVRVLELGTL